jgi:hypothetical protein
MALRPSDLRIPIKIAMVRRIPTIGFAEVAAA